MKRVLRVVGIVMLVIILGIGGFVGYLQITGIPKYEVEKVNFPQVQITPERVA